MAEESQFLSFQGIRVHYHVTAPQDAPIQRVAILSSPFIHAFHWRKIIPELTQLGCLTVLIDLPGFGRSDCSLPAPQDSLTRANMFWGILDTVDQQTGNPDSLWHIVGHGTACSTVLEMCGLYPDSVKSQAHISPLITLPNVFGRSSPDKWFRDTVSNTDNFRRMVEHFSGYPMDDYIIDRMQLPLKRRGTLGNFMRMVHNAEKQPGCDSGFCPAMVLLGTRDPLLDETRRNEIGTFLKGAELHELRSAGHFPMETHSKALRDYLRGWIRYNS